MFIATSYLQVSAEIKFKIIFFLYELWALTLCFSSFESKDCSNPRRNNRFGSKGAVHEYRYVSGYDASIKNGIPLLGKTLVSARL